MSAWVVSKLHIDLLVSALAEFGVTRHHLGADAKAIGQALWRENVESVKHLYGLDKPRAKRTENLGAPDDELAGYEAAIDAYEPREFVGLKPGPILKLVHCYDYQSCEHPGWEGSNARAAMERLIDALARKLPGYDRNVPWGVDSEDQLGIFCEPQAISLTSLARQAEAGRAARRARR